MKKLIFAVVVVMLAATSVWSSGKPEQGFVDEHGLENFMVESDRFLIQTGLDLPNDYSNGQKVPAVIFVGGSSDPVFPDYTDGMMDTFLREPFGDRGYAIIHYNKRGVGASTGNSRWGSIESRTEDLLAIAEFYRNDPRIDPDAIGVVGHSQGGWVVTRAGMLDPRLAFIISLSGPTTAVWEQDRGYYEIEFRCQGLSEEEIGKELQRIDRKHNRFRRFGGWFPLFGFRLMHNILDYDPRESLLALQQPTLIALAEYDNQAPADASADRLAQIFPSDLPEQITLHVAPGTDHFFHVTDTYCLDYAAALDDPFSPEFIEFYDEWIETNTPAAN